MPRNKMTDLRNHLFETLERLKDEENPMDLQRAKAISDVAQTLINSAKVEVEFLQMTDGGDSEFFDARVIDMERPGLAASDPRRLPRRTQ